MVRSSSLKNKLLALLLAIARWKRLQRLVARVYQPVYRMLPVDRLGENAHWSAFHHPQPNYPLHILILPGSAIPTLSAASGCDSAVYAALFQLVNQLIQDFNLEQRGYRLITNGGPYQSIPIWHWHLVSEAFSQDGADPGDSYG
ncbi:MAG: HIT domain-containing protein [Anaerolineaceae bacterium]